MKQTFQNECICISSFFEFPQECFAYMIQSYYQQKHQKSEKVHKKQKSLQMQNEILCTTLPVALKSVPIQFSHQVVSIKTTYSPNAFQFSIGLW